MSKKYPRHSYVHFLQKVMRDSHLPANIIDRRDNLLNRNNPTYRKQYWIYKLNTGDKIGCPV